MNGREGHDWGGEVKIWNATPSRLAVWSDAAMVGA
jgi:hypothetical protein